MRPLSQLNLLYAMQPPTAEDISAFEEFFSVTLPPAYVAFLQIGNGASPEADTVEFNTGGGVQGSATVDTFYSLSANQNDFNGVWLNTELLQETVEREQIVAVGAIDETNTFFLDLSNSKQSVHILYRSVNNATLQIAETFEAFIEKLQSQPE